MTVTPTRPTIAAIVVFLVLSLLHLTALFAGWAPVSEWTKPFLMPALGIAVICAGGIRFGRPGILLLVALAASTVGDSALLSAGDTAFIVGLGAFLIAHLTYGAIFVGPTGSGRPRPWLVVFVAWLAVLLFVLVPHLGPLLLPVIGYGIVIACMAITATRCTPLVLIGATLFLVSDSLLAVNRFVPDAGIWEPDLVIMVTYIAGQALLAWGIVATWYDRTRQPIAVVTDSHAA